MNTEPVKNIPISQVALERDHWLVDVYPKNDDNVEIHWIEASAKHNTGPHWLVMVSVANPYNLPKLIAQALNLLEHKKKEANTEGKNKEIRAPLMRPQKGWSNNDQNRNHS